MGGGWIAKKSAKLRGFGALSSGWRVDCEEKSKIKRVVALRGRLRKKFKIKRVGALRGGWRVDCDKKVQN